MARLASIILVYLTGIYTVMAARMCYQCSTTTNPNCEDMADVTKFITCVTTADIEINCIMYKYRLGEMEIVYRGCRKPNDTCDDVGNALEQEQREMLECALCSEDLCAAAGSALESLLPLVLVSLLLKYVIQ